MNLATTWNTASKCLFRVAMGCRKLLPRQRSYAFGLSSTKECPRIERVYVINLDRHPDRWHDMKRELRHILEWSVAELCHLAERFAAVDSNEFIKEPRKNAEIDPA